MSEALPAIWVVPCIACLVAGSSMIHEATPRDVESVGVYKPSQMPRARPSWMAWMREVGSGGKWLSVRGQLSDQESMRWHRVGKLGGVGVMSAAEPSKRVWPKPLMRAIAHQRMGGGWVTN